MGKDGKSSWGRGILDFKINEEKKRGTDDGDGRGEDFQVRGGGNEGKGA